MPRHERHRRRDTAVGDGNSRVRRRGDARRDAGYDLEGDSRGRERLGLLAAAPEDERIPTFEPNDALPFARQPNDQGADLLLARRIGAAPALADVVLLGLRPEAEEQRRVGERVVHDGVTRREEVSSTDGNEPRVSRAGAHEIDHPRASSSLVRRHGTLAPLDPWPPAAARGRAARATRAVRHTRRRPRRPTRTPRDSTPPCRGVRPGASSLSSVPLDYAQRGPTDAVP